ncbi:MAG: glycosyltransferase family 4 protein [Verrucomicrobiaceae bacterium]
MSEGNSIRVAHYMPPYPACDGSSAFCRGLSRAMNRMERGSCPIITCREGAEEHEDEELLRYRRVSRNPFSLPEGLAEDLESNRHGLDGVVLHGTYNPPMVGLAGVLRKLKIPYLFVPHDPYPPALRKHHWVRKAVFWKIFEKGMIESARALQLLDESHERFIRELGCEVETVVLPNGCEPEMLADLEGEPERSEGRERARVFYLGRMDRNHKGLDLLIEGFGLFLKKTGAEAELVLTGNDWHDREELENLAKELGLEERVIFTGRSKRPSVCLHREADLVVLPSRFDGFGLTIVEAMLVGRPVLVSREAGVARHVERAGGGWVVKPEAGEIALGLESAFADRGKWGEFGEKNRDYVLNHLTWDQVATRTFEVYREIFGAGR